MASLLPLSRTTTQECNGHSEITFQGPEVSTTNEPEQPAGLLVVIYPDRSLAVATTKENEELVIGKVVEEQEEQLPEEETASRFPFLSTNPSTMYMRLARYYSNPMRTRRRKFLVSTKYVYLSFFCALWIVIYSSPSVFVYSWCILYITTLIRHPILFTPTLRNTFLLSLHSAPHLHCTRGFVGNYWSV